MLDHIAVSLFFPTFQLLILSALMLEESQIPS